MIDPEKLRRGDRRTLARAITLIESTRPEHRAEAEALLERIMADTGGSLRVGITGIPGAGKSTFIDALGELLIGRGHRMAVLTVDPSSAVSGGSILGDKTRMNWLSSRTEAFIRPSPAGMTLGGVARRTREAILLCEAAGYDVVIVETVGVGQSETLVSAMTDVFVLLLVPAAGDDLQGIKRGIMELADLVVVNKADGALEARATLAVADLTHALHMLRPRLAGWEVPVMAISSLQKRGIDDVWARVEAYRQALAVEDGLMQRRRQQAVDWLWRETGDLLLDTLRADPAFGARMSRLQARVRDGKIPASVAAARLARDYLTTIRRGGGIHPPDRAMAPDST